MRTRIHAIDQAREFGCVERSEDTVASVHSFLRTTPVAFAHRGGAGAHPENTMRAFRHAISLGYRYLETDVHLTRDGVLIAFHDSRLDRVTDAQGSIQDLSWDEVSSARIGGTDPILRLDDLLGALPNARVNIDPKTDRAVEALAVMIQELGVEDRVCVTSFRRRRTRRVKALVGSGLCTGGASLATLATMVGIGRRLFTRGVDVLQVPPSVGPITIVDRRFVERAHRWGLHVHVWTIDDPCEMARLLDLGVDGIMTDQPTVLRDVFAARGLDLA